MTGLRRIHEILNAAAEAAAVIEGQRKTAARAAADAGARDATSSSDASSRGTSSREAGQ